jgi:AcrR family transcriptional regulator
MPTAPASTRPGPREAGKQAKRDRITRAARFLFERDGFERTTARAIAARARVATGTLFLYARDKRDLLFLVFQDDARRLFAEAGATLRDDTSLVDALMTLFGGFIDYYARHPDLSKAIVQELFFREHDPARMGALSFEYGAQVSALVERARARREIGDAGPLDAVTGALFAHYAFWVQAWLGTRLVTRAQAETGLRRALELQIEGLR